MFLLIGKRYIRPQLNEIEVVLVLFLGSVMWHDQVQVINASMNIASRSFKRGKKDQYSFANINYSMSVRKVCFAVYCF